MFKSLTLFQLKQATADVLAPLPEALSRKAFKPCLPKQEQARGFVAPIEGGSELIYTANGGTLICLRTDTKEIPSSAVKQELAKRMAAAAEKGEEFNKTDESLAKTDIKEGYLPGIPAATSLIFAYIDSKLHMMLVGASEEAAVDFKNFLEDALGSKSFKQLGLADVDPCDKFTAWVKDDETLEERFVLGHQGDLKHPNKEGGCGIINAKKEDLDSDEFLSLIEAGRQVCSIALEHENLGLRITSTLGIRNVTLGDDVKAETYDEEAEAVTRPYEFAAFVPAMRDVIQDLEKLLGGWPHQEVLDLKDQQEDEESAA